ncbi:unnamed protein product [Nyctereutes procyonoides]|uniref:(raccoon dog) hypothetical protein n=1 Tax=Nyctereutes procyonoides TaxID=34880 RepID=A0A811Z736_NYCPR|nr:unnamed protein product [Nyctereutes procyonoides]
MPIPLGTHCDHISFLSDSYFYPFRPRSHTDHPFRWKFLILSKIIAKLQFYTIHNIIQASTMIFIGVPIYILVYVKSVLNLCVYIYSNILKVIRKKKIVTMYSDGLHQTSSIADYIRQKKDSVFWNTKHFLLGLEIRQEWPPWPLLFKIVFESPGPGQLGLNGPSSSVFPTSRCHRSGTTHLLNNGSGVGVLQSLEHMIAAVRSKVLEIHSHFPHKPIILISWSTGAKYVTVAVFLGFPLLNVDGPRGDVDDPRVDIKTPVLFAIGQNSLQCYSEAMEDFQEKIRSENSLAVVGGAYDNLRIHKAKQKSEGLTQSMVDRCIQDEIVDFLTGVLTHTKGHMGSEPHDQDAKKPQDAACRHLAFEVPEQGSLEDLSSVSSSPTSSPKTKVTPMTSAQKSSQIRSSQLLKRHVQQTEAVLTHKQAQVPISSEQTEEAEKEDLRVQLKHHHPSSPLPGSKTSKGVPEAAGGKPITMMLGAGFSGGEVSASPASSVSSSTAPGAFHTLQSCLPAASFKASASACRISAARKTSGLPANPSPGPAPQATSVKLPTPMQSLGAITMGTSTIVHTIPVVTTLSSLEATPGGKPTAIHQLLTNGGLAKLASSLPGLAQISNQASGLKVPTTITLTLHGQLSRITTLSPMGSRAAPTEEPSSQALPSSLQSCSLPLPLPPLPH